jgi:hypothetical protein
MNKWRDSFPVRASRRLYINHNTACPVCGQSDPLLLGEDGRCANCSSHTKEEKHHLLWKPFRKSRVDQQAVIAVSPNAHRLLSDLQAGHAIPPVVDPDSESFIDALLLELIASLGELWKVLVYLNEKHDVSQDLPRVIAILLALWFMSHITKFDFSHLVERTRIKLRANIT